MCTCSTIDDLQAYNGVRCTRKKELFYSWALSEPAIRSCRRPQQAGFMPNRSTIDQISALPEPYQPHSIPPNWGGTLSKGAQNSSPSPLSTLERESLSQTEIWSTRNQLIRGAFERKVHYSYFGPLWKQGIFTLQLGALWRESSPLIHCSCCWAHLKVRQATLHITVAKRDPR